MSRLSSQSNRSRWAADRGADIRPRPNLSAGRYAVTPCNEFESGYRIYRQDLAPGSPAPTDPRIEAGWLSASDVWTDAGEIAIACAGDADVYLACFGRDVFLRNEGGRLVDATDEAGLGCELWGTGAVFGDVPGRPAGFVARGEDMRGLLTEITSGRSCSSAELRRGPCGALNKTLGGRQSCRRAKSLPTASWDDSSSSGFLRTA